MKPLSRIFRFAALSLATALFAVAPALAASTSAPVNHLHLMSTNAQLNHSINSSHIKLGQPVTARLTMKLRAPGSVTLPRNTQLIGKVSRLQQGQSKMTSLSLVFTKARLRNGRVIPIKATLLGAMPPAYGYSLQDHFPSISKHVASDAQVTQEPGSLRNIALHSSVLSHNSGTFKNKRGKIDLRAGTQLRIAIAPLQNFTTKAG